MRVAFAKGRIDREAEATFAAGLQRRPPFYFFSQIVRDLELACRRRGWAVDIVSIGKPGEQRLRLPHVVVNLITEPLVCRRALDRLEAFRCAHELPIINEVEAVRRSSRVQLASVIGAHHISGVRVPLTTRFMGTPSGLVQHIEKAGHEYPVLLRPTGTHGSSGLLRIANRQAVSDISAPTSDFLVSQYVDFKSADGLYRKYRVICVEGAIFRRHVIAGLDWNVTGAARAAMVGRPQTIEAEKAFLAARGDALDARLAELFRIVGLDFGVMDFAVSDDNEIIVFELNGTFQISGSIPADRRERWGYLEANNRAVLDALLNLISRRAVSAASSPMAS
jgi:hypothetical protein